MTTVNEPTKAARDVARAAEDAHLEKIRHALWRNVESALADISTVAVSVSFLSVGAADFCVTVYWRSPGDAWNNVVLHEEWLPTTVILVPGLVWLPAFVDRVRAAHARHVLAARGRP